MNTLKQIVMDNGCDPMDWSADERREAVVELFEQDEAQATKRLMEAWWICDALSELAANKKERTAIIEALKHDNAAMRHAALGIIVERFLVSFPLDHLQRVAEEHEANWIARAS